MIRIEEQPEPLDFGTKVRNPGSLFLKKNPNPKDWTGNEYWQDVLNDLYDAYSGICAYSAQWIQRDVGVSTVDHYVPKSANPKLAYEWGNYRLAAHRYNARKHTFQDVLDPFSIGDRWFLLQFPSLQVKPNPSLTPTEITQVQNSINRLKLNDELSIRSRVNWVMALVEGEITFEFLRGRAPFVARELEFANLVNTSSLRGMFKYPEHRSTLKPSKNGSGHAG